MKKLSLIIPCYNEEQNIITIIERIHKLVLKFQDIEIILVNNGSTDNSEQMFTKYLSQYNIPSIRLVHVKKNQGYGYGILAGLKEATGDFLSWTHADLQTDPLDVLKTYHRLKKEEFNENIVIKGLRKNRNPFDLLFTLLMSVVTFIQLKVWLHDINAQPKLFSKQLYNQMQNPPFDFSLDLYLLYYAKVKKYRILTVPVLFKKRLYGEAKGGGSFNTKLKLIKRTFSYISHLKKNIKEKQVV